MYISCFVDVSTNMITKIWLHHHVKTTFYYYYVSASIYG